MLRKTVVLLSALLAVSYAHADYPRPDIDVEIGDERVQTTVGLRPYRKTGIRLDRSTHGKLIFWHNYGHGGSGITLSWGTAEHVVQRAKARGDLRGRERVYVLGAGVIGLSTALLLTEQGYKVTLISKDLPHSTTSMLAGGLWKPAGVNLQDTADSDVVDHILRRSYQIFKERLGQFSVHEMPYFKTGLTKTPDPKPYSIQDLARKKIIEPPKWHERLPIEGVSQGGAELQLLLIDLPKYLPELLNGLLEQDALIVQREIPSLEELEKWITSDGESQVVFNCTGLGSRKLFGDLDLIPVRGDLVWVSRVGNDSKVLDTDFMIAHDNGYLFPRSGEYVLGGTYEKGVWDTTPDLDVSHMILTGHQTFFGL